MRAAVRDSRRFTGLPFYVLGAALLVGGLMPLFVAKVDGEWSMIFINFWILREPAIPATKLMCVYPMIAGAVMLAMARRTGFSRGGTAMVMGVLPLVLFVFEPEAMRMVRLPGLPRFTWGLYTVAVYAALLGLFSGGLALRYQLENRVAGLISAGGGACYLISLVMPMQGPYGGLTIPLAEPFRLLVTSPISGMATFLLTCEFVKLVTMIYASVSGIRMIWSRDHEPGRRIVPLLLAVLGITVVEAAVSFVMVYLGSMSSYPTTFGGAVILATIWDYLKLVLWFGGLFLLLPIGLTDLVLAMVTQRTEPPGFDVVAVQRVEEVVTGGGERVARDR